MYRKIILVLLILALLFNLCACQEKVVKPDTPTNTAVLVKYAITSGNYERFNSLFSDMRKDVISEKEFETLVELSEVGAGLSTFEVIEFSNGEVLLIRIAEDFEKDKYNVEDVIVVPDNMKYIFHTSLENYR